uniref:Uncharacterized protein n=1 Tax=Cannabis sativa TaxID=3483 RepID=A0A803PB20_CANSA
MGPSYTAPPTTLAPAQQPLSNPPNAWPDSMALAHGQPPVNEAVIPIQASLPMPPIPTVTVPDWHSVPISQVFSTTLSDLAGSQPLQFTVGASLQPARSVPQARTNRKFTSNHPSGINEVEFRKMLKRNRSIAHSLYKASAIEVGDA